MQKLLNLFLQKAAARNANVIYVQLYEEDRLKAEYRRLPAKTRLNTWSVSKPFVAMAAGIAVREGLITLEEPIHPLFKDFIPANAPEHLHRITVRHLLTMSSGISRPLFFCDDPQRYQVKDWIQYFFKQGDFKYEPGTYFLYSNFNAYILSCFIEKKAGCSLLEYLRHRLFEPLGIGNPDWTLCPHGHCMAANGLYLTIDELASFGHMLLHKGAFQGCRIVPEEFVKEACSMQISSYNTPEEKNDYESFGYGYFIRMAPVPNAVMMNGNYGQSCIVYPERNAVLCLMSLEGNYHREIREDLIDAMAEYYGVKLLSVKDTADHSVPGNHNSSYISQSKSPQQADGT